MTMSHTNILVNFYLNPKAKLLEKAALPLPVTTIRSPEAFFSRGALTLAQLPLLIPPQEVPAESKTRWDFDMEITSIKNGHFLFVPAGYTKNCTKIQSEDVSRQSVYMWIREKTLTTKADYEIHILPDPSNKWDSNALQLVFKCDDLCFDLGFIPKSFNVSFAKIMSKIEKISLHSIQYDGKYYMPILDCEYSPMFLAEDKDFKESISLSSQSRFALLEE